jgi:hypothetical protein
MNSRAWRLGLLALGGAGLLAGLSGALVLLGVWTPAPAGHLAASHGLLMTLGFLGTLIALERAVALGQWWGYLAPLAAGIGALALISGAPDAIASLLLAIAGGTFVAMYVAFDRIQRSLHGTIQALGAVAWLGAALLLALGWTPRQAVPWLAAFLVLTIVGERLELSRLVQLTERTRLAFTLGVAAFCGGVLLTVAAADLGTRLAGAGLVWVALWLARNDLARRTVRMSGLPRFVAASLLIGYGWLIVGGMAWIVFGAQPSIAAYDAMLHAVFLGFAISMVFGHAPIILPAVLRLSLPYHPRFYAHLALLHAGLLLRIVGGDLLGSRVAFQAGGILNVVALLVFVVSSAAAILAAGRVSPRRTGRATARAAASARVAVAQARAGAEPPLPPE